MPTARTVPAVKFCPYCGSDRVLIVCGVPRCQACRKTFFVQFGHQMRAKRAT